MQPATLRASAVLALALLAGAGPWARGPTRGGVSDDEFIAALGDETSAVPVDRKRLARLFFGIAATLDGGRSSVRLLQARGRPLDGQRGAAPELLEARYALYEKEMERFRRSVASLLDDPQSLPLLYRVLSDGQRACWQLDLHHALLETYAGGAGLAASLSSREACSRFRAAALQPRVEALIRDGLDEQVNQRREIRRLEEELRDLEALLADLREIDAAP